MSGSGQSNGSCIYVQDFMFSRMRMKQWQTKLEVWSAATCGRDKLHKYCRDERSHFIWVGLSYHILKCLAVLGGQSYKGFCTAAMYVSQKRNVLLNYVRMLSTTVTQMYSAPQNSKNLLNSTIVQKQCYVCMW